ncbi:MAG: 4-hydroxybenzoate octaprenyltransferase, partial [Alphaproteobacteria bacterium]|nr:4-hydroxybenzoate octaprenyltransferase [Alphaproteobacteria bacterium]
MNSSASDIPAQSWIDRLAPAVTRPYLRLMRLDRPIGTWLLLFPCWWSVALAAQGTPEAQLLILFAAGAIIMRGAGCVMNDIADRGFDTRVARTRTRPLASGEIGVRQALLFLAALLAGGFLVLVQFNAFAILVGAASLVLVAAYPFAKRVTYWPQAVLGLTFNWGALLGWAAVRGELAAPALALYIAGIFWTLGYDTIYAHQDKEDDLIAGVKSTALKLGDKTRPWLVVFYVLFLALLALAGILAGTGAPFFLALAAVAVHLFWQVRSVDLASPTSCLDVFKSNRI